MKLRSFINFIKQLGHWLWKGIFHILTFMVVIGTILYLTGVWNFCPKIVAAFMSILGLYTILTQQIRDAKQFADQKPNTLRNWIMSHPTRKPTVGSLEGGLLELMGGKAHATISISKNATIKKKVDFLLNQVNHLQIVIDKVDDRINEVTSSMTNTSKELRADLKNLNASLQTIIAEHTVGAYDINMFGIIITLCGTLIQLFHS